MLKFVLLLPYPKPDYTCLGSVQVFQCHVHSFLMTYVWFSKGKERRTAATMLPPHAQGALGSWDAQQYLVTRPSAPPWRVQVRMLLGQSASTQVSS